MHKHFYLMTVVQSNQTTKQTNKNLCNENIIYILQLNMVHFKPT